MCDFINSGMLHKTLCICISMARINLFPKESMTPKRLGNTALKLPGSCQSNFLCFHGSWLQVISIFRISSWPKVYGCVEASIPMKKEPCSCIHLAVHLSILLSTYPSMHPSTYLLLSLLTRPHICWSTHSLGTLWRVHCACFYGITPESAWYYGSVTEMTEIESDTDHALKELRI